MHVVDAEEVHVLHVPAEEGLPHPKVGHGCGDAWNARHIVLREQAPQILNVPPLHLLVKEAHGRVRAVQGRVQGYRAPKGPLQQIILAVTCVVENKRILNSGCGISFKPTVGDCRNVATLNRLLSNSPSSVSKAPEAC